MKLALPSYLLISLLFLSISCKKKSEDWSSKTEITKWKDGKNGAISVTYDDGIINQMTIAKPIMDSLGLPATFFIITGKVAGSQKGKFIGRDPMAIIEETSTIKTDSTNFFERASLIAFTGSSEAELYHANAGSLFESGKIKEAYELIDEGFEKIRKKQMQDTDEVVFHNNKEDTTSWDQYREYQSQGHEISSHTVTHPKLAVLDEANMRYELEQSKADLAKFLGEKSTFTAEGPYGTENERVIDYAHQTYSALRNRMPEDWLTEINRGSKDSPVNTSKEYVQWQRGILTNSSEELMESWINTTSTNENIWLVLVIHGVEDFGWEPKTENELREYFVYMKSKEPEVWIGTFGDVTKYLRERKATQLSATLSGDELIIDLASELDSEVYDVPLTIKTYVPDNWKAASITTSIGEIDTDTFSDEGGEFVIFNVAPSEKSILLKNKMNSE